MLHAISFRLATLDTSLPEGGNREEQAPPLPKLILPRKINFTCAKHKLHCKATSLGVAKLHRTARCLPSHKKAPSGRELAAKQTEGERDRTTYHKAMVYAPMLHAISFRLAMLNTSLPEGGNRDVEVAKSPTGTLCRINIVHRHAFITSKRCVLHQKTSFFHHTNFWGI